MGIFGKKDPQPGDRPSMSETIRMAREMQRAYQPSVDAGRPAPGQQQSMEQMMASANAAMAAMTGQATTAGGQTWMDAILHPQTDFMRHAECAQCGGQKKLPSPTAYMYCDYCAALVDFDFRKLVEGPLEQGDPAYAAQINGLNAQMRTAKEAGDRNTYGQLQYQLMDAFLTHTPKGASHRIGDPTYRTAYLNYAAQCAVLTAFDPEFQALDAQMRQRVAALVWTGGMVSRMVDPNSFWPLLDVVMQQAARGMALQDQAGIIDPDHAPHPVLARMGTSVMVQGWMPYMSPEAGEEMLTRAGLQGEYQRMEPIADGQPRHCGKCGEQFIALPGAKVAVCDHCGHQLEVGAAEWPCGNCGGLMTMPMGSPTTTCPYCKALVERVGR